MECWGCWFQWPTRHPSNWFHPHPSRLQLLYSICSSRYYQVSTITRFLPDLPTNSVMFCWLFTIKDQCENCGVFLWTHSHGMLCLTFLTVSWNLRAWRDTPRTACFSEALEATQEVRLRALEGRGFSSASPSWVRAREEGVAGRKEREQCFPNEGLFFTNRFEELKSFSKRYL